MAIEQEGKEIETGTAEWAAMSPEAGQILEVDTERTSASVGAPGWAAFFIVEVANESDGSFLISARFMGAEDKVCERWSNPSLSFSTLHRVSTLGSATCYKGEIVEMGEFQGDGLFKPKYCSYSATLARRVSRACKRTQAKGSSNPQRRRRSQTYEEEGRTSQEGSRWSSSGIWDHPRDERKTSFKTRRHTQKGTSYSWRTRTRWKRTRRRATSGGELRGFKLRLCTYIPGGTSRIEDRNSHGTYSNSGAGNSRSTTREVEDEEGRSWGEGYKRSYYEELEWAADSESIGRHGETKGTEKEEKEEVKVVRELSPSEPAREDPYEGEVGEGQEIEKEKGEEEETQDIERWSDSELQQHLNRVVQLRREDFGQRFRPAWKLR